MRRDDLIAFGTTFSLFAVASFAVISFSGFISSELSCIERCKIDLQACTMKTCIKTQEIKAVKKSVKKPIKQEKILKKEPKPLKKEKVLAKNPTFKEPVKEEKAVQKVEKALENKEEIVAQQAVEKTMEAQSKKLTVSASVIDERTRFFTRIKEEINSHKRYPRIALRRSIEGEVKVNFTIFADGSIKINELKGHRFFKENSQEALMETFPITIPKELKLTFPLNLSVDIRYYLS